MMITGAVNFETKYRYLGIELRAMRVFEAALACPSGAKARGLFGYLRHD